MSLQAYSLRETMALPSITEVARCWSNRCLRCDAPGDAWTEDGHDLDEDRWPYGPGDIRFKGRLLLMSGDEATAENTAPYCRRCWTYLQPRAVTLDWLCEFRDRKALTQQPVTFDQWLTAEVAQFYETRMAARRSRGQSWRIPLSMRSVSTSTTGWPPVSKPTPATGPKRSRTVARADDSALLAARRHDPAAHH